MELIGLLKLIINPGCKIELPTAVITENRIYSGGGRRIIISACEKFVFSYNGLNSIGVLNFRRISFVDMGIK
jgi:hypothetical protein